MVTIELENDDLVLRAGEQSIRVALSARNRELAHKGALTLDLVGNAQIGAVLAFTGDDPVRIGGKFQGTAGDYKQCLAVISPPVLMTPNTTYKATAVLTNGTGPSGDPNHTVSITIEV